MSLATRLSAFFLAALALVLFGFSLSLYLLARAYLHHQVDERLTAAVQTLAAVVERESDGLEWESHERDLDLGRNPAIGQVRWEVRAGDGQLVRCSANLAANGLWPDTRTPSLAEDQGIETWDKDGQKWKVAWRRVRADSPAGRETPGTQDPPRSPRRYAILVLTAGISLEPLHGTLRTLAITLLGLSLVLWLTAAFAGRWVCRRGLAPVARMAATARAMDADALHQRLPSPETHDELEDLRQAFNDLLGRVQEAFERQRRFTGDASHQLRTPLTAILGELEVVQRRSRSAEEYQQAIRRVHGQADHLRQVVEMLLFLARADAEADLGVLEGVNLVAWVREQFAHWSEHPRRADLHLDVSVAGPLWIRAQAPLLTQLLDNLLDNALKYSAEGTLVRVRIGQDDGRVVLAVEDQGCGIAAADLPQVFEPFYRSPQVRLLGRPGVGLGLAVARRIAVAFGGTLEAESSEGQGSRLILRLPGLPVPPDPGD